MGAVHKPLVSIIMPVYNAFNYIETAINSILAQTYKNWELLILDDFSRDGTLHKIESFRRDIRVSIYKNKHNIGYLKSCNKLFSLAKGDLITFQDADDWSDPQRIASQVEVFDKNPNIGICGTWAKYYTGDGKPFKEKKPAIDHDTILERIYNESQFCGASIMIKREVLQTAGYYKVFFDRIGNEDYDWSMRIIEQYQATNIPEFLYNVRVVKGSVSKKLGNHRKFFSNKTAVFLAMERQRYGMDSLNVQDSVQNTPLDFYLRELDTPYLADPSKKYREASFVNFYAGIFNQSLVYALLAIKTKPFKLINWKAFIAVLLKGFTK